MQAGHSHTHVHVRTIAHPHLHIPLLPPRPPFADLSECGVAFAFLGFPDGIITRLPGAAEGRRPELGLGAAFVLGERDHEGLCSQQQDGGEPSGLEPRGLDFCPCSNADQVHDPGHSLNPSGPQFPRLFREGAAEGEGWPQVA